MVTMSQESQLLQGVSEEWNMEREKEGYKRRDHL